MRKISLSLFVLAFCISGKTEIFSLSNSPLKSQLDKDLWGQIDAWPKGEMTNGLFCALQMSSLSVCSIAVCNTTTNSYFILGLPNEATLMVSLFDNNGNRVAETGKSPKFVNWTQKEMGDWFEEHIHTHGIGFGVPPQLYVDTVGFNIPEFFQLKQAGEYTLHVRKRLVRDKHDAAGKLVFESLWLPEVITKVQIRPEDVLPADLPSKSQTNSPAK